MIAAVGNSARQCYESGGFLTSMSGTEMIAQIQLLNIPDPRHARLLILERQQEIERICNSCDPMLVKLGGGFRALDVHDRRYASGPMVITHIVVDTRDAMGANAINTMAERLAPDLARWTGGRSLLRIISNLADRRAGSRASDLGLRDYRGSGEVRDAISRPIISRTTIRIAPPHTTKAS